MTTRRTTTVRLFVLAALAGLLACRAYAAAQWQPAELASGKTTRVQALFDTPLRDVAVCRAGDAWYLTGTVAGPDGGFQDNDGVEIWMSADMKDWRHLGGVWSIEEDAAADSWQRERRVNPDDPEGPLVRGMTSPEVRHFDGTFWITYSMNAQGTGLLKSTTGKAEGPYTDMGRITRQGTDASVFVDDDGTAYWVVGQGWIAPLNAERNGLAAEPRLLRPAPFPSATRRHGIESTHSPRYLGVAGAHLFKANGQYWLTAGHVRDRIGVGCYDTFVAGSESLMGPYREPHLMTAHGGQATVFQGPDGAWHATFAGRDSRAVLRDRPALLRLVFDAGILYGRAAKVPFPRAGFDVSTEFGPWDRVRKVAPFHIRDLQFSFGPDGWAYLTGSGTDEAYAGRIMVFRSKDMKDWEPVDVKFDFMSIPGVTEEDYRLRFEAPGAERGLQAKYMDSEIYYVADTFHIFTSLYGFNATKADGTRPWGGPMWLRSTTGKPEGPYEYVGRSRSQNSAFVDDDGKTYIFYNGNLQEWDPAGDDMDAGKRISLKTTAGTAFTKGDVATNLLKIHGKYVVFGTGWCGGTYGENYRVDGTYDWVYWQSDTLEGPYEMPRRAYAMPHCGHSCPPLKGPDGRWYGLFFGNDSTGPWWNYPGVLVFDVRLDPDDTIRIEIKDEVP